MSAEAAANLLKSPARQMLLQRALGLRAMEHFQTPLLHDDACVRLAKRHDALAIRMLQDQGLTRTQVPERAAELSAYSLRPTQASMAPE